MEKLNIAELLKNCPTGMELDCTIFDNVTFERVTHGGIWINYINNRNYKYDVYLDNEGCLPVSSLNLKTTKCVIFPKGKTTWEGFQRPFKDGDIIYNKFIQAVAIFCKQTDEGTISHCFLNRFKELKIKHYHSKFLTDWKLATEEEKQKLFDAIEMNGYKWNAETKTLEKLPEFKDGDIIFAQYYDLKYIAIVKQIDKSSDIHVHCLYGFTDAVFAIDEILGSLKESLKIRFATEEEKQKLFQSIKDNGYKWNSKNKTLEKLIKPIFKVGDRIRPKNNKAITKTIGFIFSDSYALYDGRLIFFKDQEDYELVFNKFEINTLKPFDKVLIRDKYTQKWCISFFSHYDKHGIYKYFCINGCVYMQCIPYKGNEYLCGTTDDCSDYYKTWE